ncbi:MAG: hypothetical protein MJZ68_05365 [archaeon]|nr:hypothetical protein [archaeon]
MNSEISLQDLPADSTKKVYWMCEKGHEWMASPLQRLKGEGCEECIKTYGIRKIPKVSPELSLETHVPELMKEWHPTKNKDLDPSEIYYKSHAEAWWMCASGHESKIRINVKKTNYCRKCNTEYRTSFPEKTIAYYLGKITDVEESITPFEGYKGELDIYLPRYNIGIEFDGSHFHNDVNKDLKKNDYCRKNGIRLIRVREIDCPELPNCECINMEGRGIKELEIAIRKLLDILHDDFSIDTDITIDIKADQIDIYNKYICQVKETSLLSRFPEIAKEWHPTKNGNLRPDMIRPISSKEVWWKADCGHEWFMSISCRTNNGGNCPYCSGRRVLSGFNDLQTKYPDIAKEWHPTKNGSLLPSQITAHSPERVYWQCAQGHEWESSIDNRTNSGCNCPICSFELIVPGINDFMTLYPNATKMLHPTKNGNFDFSSISPYSHYPAWWSCENGHEWQSEVKTRLSSVDCPYCTNKFALKGYNDLETVMPKLASMWNHERNMYLKPSNVTYRCQRNIWWKCDKGHEWKAGVPKMMRNRECPYCTGKAIWVPLKPPVTKPPEVKPNPYRLEVEKEPSLWTCPNGHKIPDIVKNKKGLNVCPICNDSKLRPGINDLESQNDKIDDYWDHSRNGDLLPKHIPVASTFKVWLKCSLGHIWKTAPNYFPVRISCPICSGKIIWSGFNDLATLRPDLVDEWDYSKNKMEPNDISAGCEKKVYWICPNGHEYESSVANRNIGRECPICRKSRKYNRKRTK